jgi:peptidyl-prolyl cis-trans isomerase SurA
MRAFLSLTALLLALLAPGGGVLAQGSPFAPVLLVNDLGITAFEIEQRKLFLALLRAPGDLDKEAEKALIEDRIRMSTAERMGLRLTPEQVQTGMTEFAGRAQLSLDEFITELAAVGVEPQTFRDFVEAGVAWREVVRAKFFSRVNISEAEIDRAMAPTAIRGQGTRVLISEIVLAAPPGQEDQAMAIATDLSRLQGEAAFADAARQVSASGSRTNGGRLDWMEVDTLPAPIRDAILTLAPGEVSAPVPAQNALVVFLLRAVDENGAIRSVPQQLDYMQVLLPGGRAEATLAAAARLRGAVDRCNDIYGETRGLGADRILRATQPTAQIPRDIAAELARLDPGESSTALTRGDALVFLMLCNREQIAAADSPAPTRADVLAALQNARLSAYADDYLADLIADAIIRRP